MANGRYSHNQGYVRVLDAGKVVLEHRLVMERRLGRVLATDEVVHHRNEIKTDNDPVNLEVKANAEHAEAGDD
jgi:hypothetical protein